MNNLNNIVIIILTTLILFSCEEKKENDLSKENIKGNVKTIIERTFDVNKKNNDTVFRGNVYYTNFNKDGFKINLKIISKNRNYVELYKYDSVYNLTNWKCFENEKLVFETINKYDKNNNLIEKTEFEFNKYRFKYIYTYSKDSVTEIRFNKFGKMISKTVKILDKKKREIEKLFYNYENILEHKTFFKYNRKNLMTKKINIQFMKMDNKENDSTRILEIVTKYNYEYDKNSNWTKIYSSLSKKDTTFFNYKYEDVNKNWTEQIYNSPYSENLQIIKRKYLYY